MRFWSNLYALIWQRKTRNTPLKRFESLSDLVSYIRTLKWRADSWRELWDATSSIGHIQWRADNEPEKFIGDCDEFGRYSAAVMRNELQNNTRSALGIETTYLLTVMWKNKGEPGSTDHAGYGGHNVNLIKFRDGTWAYMDYGWPSTRVDTIAEVVQKVRDAQANSWEPLIYAWHDPLTLKNMGCVRG